MAHPLILKMINVNNLVYVIVVQDDFLFRDQRLLTRKIYGAKSRAEKYISAVIAMTIGLPVETYFNDCPLCFKNFQVAPQVSGPRLGQGGRSRALSTNSVHPIFQSFPIWVVNQ